MGTDNTQLYRELMNDLVPKLDLKTLAKVYIFAKRLYEYQDMGRVD